MRLPSLFRFGAELLEPEAVFDQRAAKNHSLKRTVILHEQDD